MFVPGGIFTPTFAMGAVFGQIYVSYVIKICEFFGIRSPVEFRGVYSILGAAAMTGCVTRTVSVAMIVLELNGHLSHAMPCMVCVLCSYATAELIKPQSFFEMLSELGGLDALLKKKGEIIVKDILKQTPEYKELEYLSLEDSTPEDLMEKVRKHTDPKNLKAMLYLPVVDNKESMNLMYMIKVQELKEYCQLYFGFEVEHIGFAKQLLFDQQKKIIKLPDPMEMKQKLIENKIPFDVANNVFKMICVGGNTSAKTILLNMRHIAPLVIYEHAPISYMASGTA